MMENEDVSWDQIYYDIDTILNGCKPENHEGRRKARIIRSNWSPDKSNENNEVYTAPGEIPAQPILLASARDRRHMFR